MQQGKIGVQAMMVKQEVAAHGIAEVFRRLAALGFHAVEISQIPMTPETVAEMKRAGDEYGVKVAAMSCGIEDFSPVKKYNGDTLKNDFDKIVADCHAVDCSILRIGMLPMTDAISAETMLAMADKLEAYALRLKEHGIDLYYHAHTFEFYRLAGKPILSHIRDRTTALGFELDSHWMWRGGVDPAAYVRTFAGRVRALHLKDYRIGLIQDVDAIRPGFDVFGSLEQFAEVGEGTLDMPAIIRAGLESGSEYFLIEQDATYGRDVWESLRISRDNLVKMGFGGWL